MRRSPTNVRIACNHGGLTHYGGVFFFHEFTRVLQLRDFLARHLRYPRRNQRYSLSQMALALVYPILLGLGRIETASFLRSNGTFQYLTGLPDYPDPQTLRRFLSGAPPDFRHQLHRINNRLQQRFTHCPEHRSRLILDLDSTVVTVFGHQEQAEVGYIIRAIVANAPTTPCSVWRPTRRCSGIPNCAPAMLALGKGASNCWPVASKVCRPISVS